MKEGNSWKHAISFCANCRTVSMTSCCSSVGWKSIIVLSRS